MPFGPVIPESAIPRESAIPWGSAIPRGAHGIGRQTRTRLIRRRDQTAIGRDHEEIMRIIGWFRLQRGFHWRSLLSPMSPPKGGRRIYARSTTSCPRLHSGLTKARRQGGDYRAV